MRLWVTESIFFPDDSCMCFSSKSDCCLSLPARLFVTVPATPAHSESPPDTAAERRHSGPRAVSPLGPHPGCQASTLAAYAKWPQQQGVGAVRAAPSLYVDVSSALGISTCHPGGHHPRAESSGKRVVQLMAAAESRGGFGPEIPNFNPRHCFILIGSHYTLVHNDVFYMSGTAARDHAPGLAKSPIAPTIELSTASEARDSI